MPAGFFIIRENNAIYIPLDALGCRPNLLGDFISKPLLCFAFIARFYQKRV